MKCIVSGKFIGFNDFSIKELDEYCRYFNKRIVLDGYKLKGFLTGYHVGTLS